MVESPHARSVVSARRQRRRPHLRQRCGRARHDPALADYDVIEWHREDLALITNLPMRELPLAAVGQDRLPEIPLLAPPAGLIAEFLRRWYGPNFITRLRVIAEVDSIYYGLALLRSQLVHGALICTRAAAKAAVEGRLPLAQACVWSL
ncbi:MAG TPA: hypothetical protein VFN75_03045 [Pseudonocardiaceae bacterium]|nr:hypothetical protein [Pseudonocardiaceae bacterium]